MMDAAWLEEREAIKTFLPRLFSSSNPKRLGNVSMRSLPSSVLLALPPMYASTSAGYLDNPYQKPYDFPETPMHAIPAYVHR